MWQLIEDENLKYFRCEFENKIFLYSTKVGTQKFLYTFKPALLTQIHSDIIVDIDTDTKTTGDGLMTSSKSIGVKVADCLPVYIFSQEKIMLLHCGWRSIIRGILAKALTIMREYKYVMGACIGPCCYEVKNDVARLFSEKYPEAVIRKYNKIYLDLKKAVLQELGKENLIAELNYCTYCNPDYFYSYRRGDRERNYAVFSYK
ncbi:MAG: polyphenol oxidase family protein [candidate division WOR-3 bacterium]|nr:polyphenol oxidase family protein [candidate division WOR-3 bacterium]